MSLGRLGGAERFVMSKRALRRHHRARMLARAESVQRKWWGGIKVDPLKLALAARKLADNLKCCSCFMCGNVRRFGGWVAPKLARQEIVSRMTLREFVREEFSTSSSYTE
jgi:hypothetical protein